MEYIIGFWIFAFNLNVELSQKFICLIVFLFLFGRLVFVQKLSPIDTYGGQNINFAKMTCSKLKITKCSWVKTANY